jgi:hypothetical protein
MAAPRPCETVSSTSKRGPVLYVEDEESDALFMQRAFVKMGLISELREDDKAKARDLGATDFLVKPKSGSDFLGVVEALQERRSSLTIAGRTHP